MRWEIVTAGVEADAVTEVNPYESDDPVTGDEVIPAVTGGPGPAVIIDKFYFIVKGTVPDVIRVISPTVVPIGR